MTHGCFRNLLAAILCGLFVTPAVSEEAELTQRSSAALLSALGAGDFATRVKAALLLHELSAAELKAIATLPDDQVTPEVIVHLLKEAEVRYAAADQHDAIAISELLETLKSSPRLALADGAQRILSQHWRVRTELARLELEKFGAKCRDGSFSSAQERRWLPRSDFPSLQVLIDENWTGGEQDLRLLERMEALTDSRLRGSAGLFVWLLDGHPLTERQQALLGELVDRSRIFERSRVALGIRGERTGLPGVLIEAITPGSSADDAGLQPGDILEAIVETIPEGLSEEEQAKEREKQLLRDFDDLVERLKAFREGDVMRVRVRRGAIRPRIPLIPIPDKDVPDRGWSEKVIEVKLKGWWSLPVHPN